MKVIYSVMFVSLLFFSASANSEDAKSLIKVPNPQEILKQYLAEEANKAAFKVNDDQAIALACIELCLGEPNCSASCTIKGLVFKEVKVCITTPNKCFGENNEIRKFINNGYKDITQGPGSGNEMVKAREAVLNGDNGEGARIIRDPIKRPVEIIKNLLKW